MAGNVWELVNDRYGDSYYGVSPGSNPRGPETGSDRAVRGGSWYYDPGNGRAAFRSGIIPTYSYYDIGFRCAHDD